MKADLRHLVESIAQPLLPAGFDLHVTDESVLAYTYSKGRYYFVSEDLPDKRAARAEWTRDIEVVLRRLRCWAASPYWSMLEVPFPDVPADEYFNDEGPPEGSP